MTDPNTVTLPPLPMGEFWAYDAEHVQDYTRTAILADRDHYRLLVDAAQEVLNDGLHRLMRHQAKLAKQERERLQARIAELEQANAAAAKYAAAPVSATSFRAEVARIADDFHPDRNSDAPLALQEMRDALTAILAAAATQDCEMQDALDAGDGTLHGAIDYWQNRALAAEAGRDTDETNATLAGHYLRLTCGRDAKSEAGPDDAQLAQQAQPVAWMKLCRKKPSRSRLSRTPGLRQAESGSGYVDVPLYAAPQPEAHQACAACGLAGQAVADEREAYRAGFEQWKAMAESLTAMIGDISDALEIPEDEQSTASGAEEIVDRIKELKASADDAKLAQLRANGAKAWAGVSYATAWVDEQRGADDARDAACNALFEAVRAFRNEPLLGRCVRLRGTQTYAELCEAWRTLAEIDAMAAAQAAKGA